MTNSVAVKTRNLRPRDRSPSSATAIFLTDERTNAATRARLLAAARLGIIAAGDLAVADIAHDDDCPALAGGPCRCIPDLSIVSRDGQRWLDVGRGFERLP